MLASQARYVAVMDADLQHDESLLLEMLQYFAREQAPISSSPAAISKEGSAAGLSRQRSRVSRWSNGLVRLLLGIDLTDPMSGYFS